MSRSAEAKRRRREKRDAERVRVWRSDPDDVRTRKHLNALPPCSATIGEHTGMGEEDLDNTKEGEA